MLIIIILAFIALTLITEYIYKNYKIYVKHLKGVHNLTISQTLGIDPNVRKFSNIKAFLKI